MERQDVLLALVEALGQTEVLIQLVGVAATIVLLEVDLVEDDRPKTRVDHADLHVVASHA